MWSPIQDPYKIKNLNKYESKTKKYHLVLEIYFTYIDIDINVLIK